MSKRPKWLDDRQGKVPAHIRKLLANSSGQGLSDAVVDRATWLDDEETGPITPALEAWITALEAIDRKGDKEPLLNFLKSNRELSRDARIYLADLLARYQLKKKRGGQTKPAYDRSEAEEMLALGINAVRYLVNPPTEALRTGKLVKMTVAMALDHVSDLHRIPREIF